MNCYLSIRDNSGLYIYTQNRELYQLPLPVIRVASPRLLYRGYLNSLNTILYRESPIFLFRNIRGQIVLLYSTDEDGTMDEIILLDDEGGDKKQYQDFHLEVIQGKLFFFYTIYHPGSGSAQLYYCLPFEQVTGTLICPLGSGAIPVPGNIEMSESTPAAVANSSPEPITAVVKEAAAEKALEALLRQAEAEKEIASLKEVIEKISAQYNDLSDYTKKLQEEAKRLKKLAES